MKIMTFLLVGTFALTTSATLASADSVQIVQHEQHAQLQHRDDRRGPGTNRRDNQRPQVRHHKKGEVLGKAHRRNVIDNHRQYGLRSPGRGESWVRYNGQFLLISASGRILAVAPSR